MTGSLDLPRSGVPTLFRLASYFSTSRTSRCEVIFFVDGTAIDLHWASLV